MTDLQHMSDEDRMTEADRWYDEWADAHYPVRNYRELRAKTEKILLRAVAGELREKREGGP